MEDGPEEIGQHLVDEVEEELPVTPVTQGSGRAVERSLQLVEEDGIHRVGRGVPPRCRERKRCVSLDPCPLQDAPHVAILLRAGRRAAVAELSAVPVAAL